MIGAALRLVRAQNGAIAALGVLIGAWWAARAVDGRTVAAMGAALCLAAVANAANDLADVEIDRVVHPERPLAAGTLTPAFARRLVAVAAALGVGLAALARPELGLLSTLVVALMIGYNHGPKRAGVAGNVVVAVLASLPFLYGAWAAGQPTRGLPLVAVAVPLHLAREVAKDVEDARGDALRRATLPLVHGAPAARWTSALAAAIFCVAVALLAGSTIRLWLAFLPAWTCATLAVRRLTTSRSGAPRLYKAAMVCAMLALFTA